MRELNVDTKFTLQIFQNTHLFRTNLRNNYGVKLSLTVNDTAVHIGYNEHGTVNHLCTSRLDQTRFMLHLTEYELSTEECFLKYLHLVKYCSTLAYCEYGKSLLQHNIYGKILQICVP